MWTCQNCGATAIDDSKEFCFECMTPSMDVVENGICFPLACVATVESPVPQPTSRADDKGLVSARNSLIRPIIKG